MKKILITGATGFLGRKIVELFHSTDWKIRATDLVPASPFDNAIEYRSIDLTTCDETVLVSLTEDINTVLHVAGFAHHAGSVTPIIRNKYFQVNTHASERLFRASIITKDLNRFVFLSTGAVYGSAPNDATFDENSDCHPEEPYAESKLEAEKLLINICSGSDVQLSILRMSTLFGEEDPGNMHRLISSIVRNRFVWIDTGKSRKTFIHRDDAAHACYLTATSDMLDKVSIYNVSGVTLKTREILQEIYRQLDKPLPKLQISGHFAKFLTHLLSCCTFHRGVPAKIHRSVAKWLEDKPGNGTKFCHDFNFTPTITMQEGLHREIEWMRSIGEIAH
ncbi:MAG: NAD(P)-dependent oxidoreductase [Planctomycetaceae bacterium]|jgi:nucleoside-diphosphate-sugar epimerase|nr:NAD(P)-dependent oxidoreductase [Planctomycetaceae bacterium]